MQGIYAIKNKVSNRIYIGSSGDIVGRWKVHSKALEKGNHDTSRLQNAWNKYGKDVFEFIVLEIVEDEDKLLSREQIYLDAGFKNEMLYNTARDALAPMRGRCHTEAAKQAIGQASSRRVPRIEASAAMMGHETSIESRQKMSMARKQAWQRGLYSTEEARRNRSQSHIGFRHSEATKRKMSKSRMGHETSEETRRKIGQAKSKSYPAFYNELTRLYFPAGVNLAALCRQFGLNSDKMGALSRGDRKQTKDGWRLATESEIASRSMSPYRKI